MQDDKNTSINEIPKDAKKMTPTQRKEVTQGVKNGTIQHKQINQGLKNLIPLNKRSKEEQLEIRRKGAKALNEIKGERKNAKQILDDLLPLYANDNAIDNNECINEDIKALIKKYHIKITQYDLIMLAMIHKAQNGDVKASEYISNHYGDIVTKDVNIKETMSESDRELIRNLSKRIGIDESELF